MSDNERAEARRRKQARIEQSARRIAENLLAQTAMAGQFSARDVARMARGDRNKMAREALNVARMLASDLDYVAAEAIPR